MDCTFLNDYILNSFMSIYLIVYIFTSWPTKTKIFTLWFFKSIFADPYIILSCPPILLPRLSFPYILPQTTTLPQLDY